MCEEFYVTPNYIKYRENMDKLIRKAEKAIVAQARKNLIKSISEKKEAPTMQVSCNGFTGELVKLERTFVTNPHVSKFARYELTISYLKDGVYSRIMFPDIGLEDVKFIGGAVTFGE